MPRGAESFSVTDSCSWQHAASLKQSALWPHVGGTNDINDHDRLLPRSLSPCQCLSLSLSFLLSQNLPGNTYHSLLPFWNSKPFVITKKTGCMTICVWCLACLYHNLRAAMYDPWYRAFGDQTRERRRTDCPSFPSLSLSLSLLCPPFLFIPGSFTVWVFLSLCVRACARVFVNEQKINVDYITVWFWAFSLDKISQALS